MELSAKTKERLSKVSTATLCTALFKRGFRNVYIQGISRLTNPSCGNLVGPAFTMRSIPAREDLDQISAFDDPNHPQRKAIESVPPGHVLVLDCRQEKRVASGGEILTTRLKMRGAAGLVSDGPVRDSGIAHEARFPDLLRRRQRAAQPALPPRDRPERPDRLRRRRRVSRRHHRRRRRRRGGDPAAPRRRSRRAVREQEKMEAFILERVQGGAKLAGTYPPNDETKAAFAEWRKEKGI